MSIMAMKTMREAIGKMEALNEAVSLDKEGAMTKDEFFSEMVKVLKAKYGKPNSVNVDLLARDYDGLLKKVDYDASKGILTLPQQEELIAYLNGMTDLKEAAENRKGFARDMNLAWSDGLIKEFLAADDKLTLHINAIEKIVFGLNNSCGKAFNETPSFFDEFSNMFKEFDSVYSRFSETIGELEVKQSEADNG
jgi:hypothetical protein